MEYVVKQFEISVDILDQEAIQKAKYPVPDEVEIDDWESTLALVPIRQLSARQKVKRFFRRRVHRFRIVLHQKRNLPREESYTFVLGTGVSRRNGEEAFGQLHETLKPLLKDGEVLLTTVLLQTAILPRPKGTQQLSCDLVQVMEKQHESHPEWVSVVQALLIDGCATGDRQQVDTLVTKAGGDLERVNKKGKTPIQTARKLAPSSGLDWLMAQLKLDSDQADHGSQSQTSLQALSQEDQHESIWEFIGSKIKDVGTRILEEIGQAEVDQQGNTPLMTAVMNGFTKSCIPLLMGGMDPNSSHPRTGDTALHCAVNCGNTTLVKLLCAFKADPCQANVKGETPLSRAKASKSTKDCLEILESVVELRKTSTAYLESKRFDPIPTGKSGSPYLLCLDGGGVRSFVMCLILLGIEDRMKELDPKCPPFGSFFDWMAGTSAGGIAALMLGHANASLQVASSFIMRSITDVFSKPKMGRRKLIEALLQDYLGDNIKMADRPSPKLIITTTLASHAPSKLHLMCNYGKPRDGQKGPEERLAWEAALATSAAPFHFPSFEGKFLDGGLIANNPTLDAMTEIFNSADDDETVELGFVLSVGTGFPPSKTVEDIEFFLPHPLKVFHLDTISGLSNLLDLFVEQVTQSNGPPVERARAWCKTIGTPYIRLSPPLSQDYSPATSDLSEIIDMLFDAYKYVLRNPEEIDKAAKLLLAKKLCDRSLDDVGTDC